MNICFVAKNVKCKKKIAYILLKHTKIIAYIFSISPDSHLGATINTVIGQNTLASNLLLAMWQKCVVLECTLKKGTEGHANEVTWPHWKLYKCLSSILKNLSSSQNSVQLFICSPGEHRKQNIYNDQTSEKLLWKVSSSAIFLC